MRMKGPTEGLPWRALEEMRRYYTDRVPYHDAYMSYSGAEEQQRLMAPLIALFEEDVRDRRVLEVACGTGNWTQVLASRARELVATDLMGEYLEAARSKAGLDGVAFQVADAYSLEGLEGPFDTVFAADWWSHIPRSMLDTFLKALAGCLVPGGRVVLIDMLRTTSMELAFCRFDAEGNEVQQRTLPNGRTYQVVKNFPPEEELRGRVEPWGEDITYHEDRDLMRWMLRFSMTGGGEV